MSCCFLFVAGFKGLLDVIMQVPALPEGLDWSEANLQPLKDYLVSAATSGVWVPDPEMPWDLTPIA